MKKYWSSVLVPAAMLLSAGFPAHGQAVTISVIDLAARKVQSTFPVCLSPQAVAWGPAAAGSGGGGGGGGGGDDDDDRDHHDGDRKDGDHHDRDRDRDHERGNRHENGRPGTDKSSRRGTKSAALRHGDDREHRDGGDEDDCDEDRDHHDGDRDHHGGDHDDDGEEHHHCGGGGGGGGTGPATVAYAVCEDDNTLRRLDLSTPTPTVSATYPLLAGLLPGNLAVNAAGTRALVAGDLNTISYLDLTTTPFIERGPIASASARVVEVAFYGTSKALIMTESDLEVVDLSTTPPAVTGVVLLTDPVGQPAAAMAVNPAGTRAAISIGSGGVQVVDLTTNPPTFVGTVVGGKGDSLGVAITADGTTAIDAYETFPNPQAMVVNTASPSVTGTVLLPTSAPSAVAFNPVTAEAYLVGDDGTSFLKPPYTTVDFTLRYPGLAGTTRHGLAVSPDGTRALIVNEDTPGYGPASIAPATGPSTGGTAVTLSGFFQTGSTVTFGGVPATSVVITGTSITAVTPAHAPGSVNIVVTAPDGQIGLLTGGFTYGP